VWIQFEGTYLALEVVITSEEKATRDRESDRGDTADRFRNL